MPTKNKTKDIYRIDEPFYVGKIVIEQLRYDDDTCHDKQVELGMTMEDDYYGHIYTGKESCDVCGFIKDALIEIGSHQFEVDDETFAVDADYQSGQSNGYIIVSLWHQIENDKHGGFVCICDDVLESVHDGSIMELYHEELLPQGVHISIGIDENKKEVVRI